VDQLNNYSNEQLADEIGKQDSSIKALEERLDVFKKAFKDRGCSAARGQNYVVTASTSISKRIDTEKLRAAMGDALAEYEKETTSTRLMIKLAPKLDEVT